MQIKCVHCGTELDPLETRCPNCGWEVESHSSPPPPAVVSTEVDQFLCPNCGTSLTGKPDNCPNCGMRLTSTWPPTIRERFLPPVPKSKHLTPFPVLDVIIGIVATIGSFWIHWGIAVVLVLGIAFYRRYPYVSRGIGCTAAISLVLGVILLIAVVLGALKACSEGKSSL